jgi:hypothetical protein
MELLMQVAFFFLVLVSIRAGFLFIDSINILCFSCSARRVR